MQEVSKLVAGAAIMGSLAVVLTFAGLEIPYPPLPYLKFDLAEIPSIVALVMYGLRCSFLVASIHFLTLASLKGLLGPFMKFLAVISTIIGFYVGERALGSLAPKALVLLSMLIAMIVRTLVMTVANYVLLIWVSPGYLTFAMECLSNVLGLNIQGEVHGLILVLLFTGIYNAIHTIMSIVPVLPLMRILRRVRL
ncbi:MAG: hypothetical protein DRN15_04085 [Thermoprotei archaeon]|nr:MAG: hypothetical protein DRN15_04085 [Thermoprotei archaeon]RLF25940.1 MAG: hypothetical protein DRM97_00085 [Thermoprotei archaeon]